MTSVETSDVVPRFRYDAAVIKNYRILDTRPELAFDSITRLMTNIFDVPFAIISIIDADRVFFKANSGMGTASSLPPDNILTRLIKKYSDKPVCKLLRQEQLDAYAGPDAALSSLQFYASVPLLNREGYKIGVISIADNRRGTFRKKEKTILENMAAIVMDEIELRKATTEETEKLLAINESKRESTDKPKYVVVDAPAALGVIVGSDLIIESAGTMYPEMAGISAQFSGTAKDISDRKKNEDLKNDFIAMVSHDLRNPLAALRANVQNMEIFLDQNISKDTKNAFKKVYQQVEK